jgi:Uma2 family endonuclease
VLLIDVSETSADYNREVKLLPPYAAAAIAEVWIVDLGAQIVEAHADPRGNAYETVTAARRRQSVASCIVPGLSLAPDDILG